MHRPAKAILKHFAISALTSFHPLTVAERLETVFPNVQKVVLIDIALRKPTVNIRASRNGAVNEDGADGDASATEIKPLTDLSLVGTHVSFATGLAVNPPLFSGRDDEVH